MNRGYILLPLIALTVLVLTACSKDQTISQAIQPEAIQTELQEQIDTLEAQKTDFSFPSWLSKTNIFAPNNMSIDESVSYQTTEQVEWFNSIHFVYHWDYDYAMTQAEVIADKANISVSAEFKMAQDIIDNMDVDALQMKELMWDMKWIVYTNYSLMGGEDVDYMIAITVNEDGSLELDVTDMIAMQKVADQYTK